MRIAPAAGLGAHVERAAGQRVRRIGPRDRVVDGEFPLVGADRRRFGNAFAGSLLGGVYVSEGRYDEAETLFAANRDFSSGDLSGAFQLNEIMHAQRTTSA